ncbi:type II toxin-antitoxin system HicB family antitoxin [Chimaeribacter arupi]|uniref:Toxin-antitoxin system HicB family antitoxin n=1 Tax=Chimaeribacter arupi TaxID=2060066 RepID=A0A2N5EJ64_9GAMM|nr:type II toxin-antitoxin system HicB family antitoxin [Chimaeribacter arupi]PLR45438.1 toxin-antitoxin system HicB family antitoxin [Chimaeribacter arupi]
MINTLKVKDHVAVIMFDPDIEMFSGEFIGLNGGADFYASSVDKLKEEGAKSLSIFLDECREIGIEPYKVFGGNLSVCLTPERHHALTIIAQAHGASINELLDEAIDLVIAKHA